MQPLAQQIALYSNNHYRNLCTGNSLQCLDTADLTKYWIASEANNNLLVYQRNVMLGVISLAWTSYTQISGLGTCVVHTVRHEADVTARVQ